MQSLRRTKRLFAIPVAALFLFYVAMPEPDAAYMLNKVVADMTPIGLGVWRHILPATNALRRLDCRRYQPSVEHFPR